MDQIHEHKTRHTEHDKKESTDQLKLIVTGNRIPTTQTLRSKVNKRPYQT